jgi:uncharacterized Zn-finger protein
MKRHLNIKQFKCDYKECDQSFVTSSHLKKHFNNNNQKTNKTFKCIYNECKQKFIKSLDLKKHLERNHKK